MEQPGFWFHARNRFSEISHLFWKTHTHTHTRLTALFPGLPGWAGTRKVKPMWILLEQETVSGSGISWAVCKSAPRSRQITTPAPHHSVFTGRMPFLSPNQERQSTEGKTINCIKILRSGRFLWMQCSQFYSRQFLTFIHTLLITT